MEPDTLRPARADIRLGVTAPAHARTCACVHLRVRAPAGRLSHLGPSPRLASHSLLSVVLCEGQQCVVRNAT